MMWMRMCGMPACKHQIQNFKIASWRQISMWTTKARRNIVLLMCKVTWKEPRVSSSDGAASLHRRQPTCQKHDNIHGPLNYKNTHPVGAIQIKWECPHAYTKSKISRRRFHLASWMQIDIPEGCSRTRLNLTGSAAKLCLQLPSTINRYLSQQNCMTVSILWETEKWRMRLTTTASLQWCD
jgi:hypothetical protein